MTLIQPGQIAISQSRLPGDLVNAQMMTASDASGVKMVAVGGITKRQQIAAMILASQIQSLDLTMSDAGRERIVASSLRWADELLRQTESPPEPAKPKVAA